MNTGAPSGTRANSETRSGSEARRQPADAGAADRVRRAVNRDPVATDPVRRELGLVAAQRQHAASVVGADPRPRQPVRDRVRAERGRRAGRAHGDREPVEHPPAVAELEHPLGDVGRRSSSGSRRRRDRDSSFSIQASSPFGSSEVGTPNQFPRTLATQKVRTEPNSVVSPTVSSTSPPGASWSSIRSPLCTRAIAKRGPRSVLRRRHASRRPAAGSLERSASSSSPLLGPGPRHRARPEPPREPPRAR